MPHTDTWNWKQGGEIRLPMRACMWMHCMIDEYEHVDCVAVVLGAQRGRATCTASSLMPRTAAAIQRARSPKRASSTAAGNCATCHPPPDTT